MLAPSRPHEVLTGLSVRKPLVAQCNGSVSRNRLISNELGSPRGPANVLRDLRTASCDHCHSASLVDCQFPKPRGGAAPGESPPRVG